MPNRFPTRWLVVLVTLTALGAATQTAADHFDDCEQAYNPDLSIRACTDLIKSGGLKRSGLAAAIYNRGLAYSDKGDYDRAIADFNKAIEIKPDFASAYNNRGIVYGHIKDDYDRAIANFDKAIEIEPDFAEAYNNRGIAYLGKDA